MQTKRSLYLCLALAITIAGCHSASKTKTPESLPQDDAQAAASPQEGRALVGTVHHITIEGGFYGIVAEDGRRYDPVNLPEEFRQDGLPVVCHVRALRNRASFHMWGQLVEIIDIRRR